MKKQNQPSPGQIAFQQVFLSHCWGNKGNGGVNYKRPYSSTNSSAAEYMEKNKKAA